MDTRSDQATTQSSIALLQERFRRLQKMREMRQERELLNMLSSVGSRLHHHHPNHHQPPCSHSYSSIQSSSSSFNFEPMAYHRPPSCNSGQLSLSLRPDSPTVKLADSRVSETAREAPSKSWLFGAGLGYNSASSNFDDSGSDVDTSLHL